MQDRELRVARVRCRLVLVSVVAVRALAWSCSSRRVTGRGQIVTLVSDIEFQIQTLQNLECGNWMRKTRRAKNARRSQYETRWIKIGQLEAKKIKPRQKNQAAGLIAGSETAQRMRRAAEQSGKRTRD